ncbi:carbonic anhydrase 2 isoform X2 [Orussus abietinus]|uniref:carbonic anhydrase 2 isoform X2 n=1 Tax=Orussus abietinus TaxID=222816 RepID=UPI0006269BDF|nr:carbonic anhydrase 2 isoform X2 [Orussus abietinus]
MTPPFLLLLSLLSGITARAEDFGYEGPHGPSHWGQEYDSCVGKHQSPINIEEHHVRNVSLPPLSFYGLDVPRSAFIVNNGHTVMLKLNHSEYAQISGGPLGNRSYVFEQLHFHWGKNDWEGSEDLINNHSFAMELHVVFFRLDYGNMEEAVNHPDGLVVLAYFFEALDESNPTYEGIVKALPSVETVGAMGKLKQPLILEDLLVPKVADLHNYFTYDGSLTTPPCSEVVTWIDFKDPLPLSHLQIAAFRNVRTSEGHRLTHNFRPVQPLADRLVFHNIPHLYKEEDESHVDEVPSNHLPHEITPEYGHSGQFKIKASFFTISIAFLISLR